MLADRNSVGTATSGIIRSSDPPAIRPSDALKHVLLPVDPDADVLEVVDLVCELAVDVPWHVASRVPIQLVNLTQQETVIFVRQHAGTGRRRFGESTVDVAERQNASACDPSRKLVGMLDQPTEAVGSSCPGACRDSGLYGC